MLHVGGGIPLQRGWLAPTPRSTHLPLHLFVLLLLLRRCHPVTLPSAHPCVCSMTSGAIQHGVPTKVMRATLSCPQDPVRSMDAATPKSPSHTWPSLSIKMLPACEVHEGSGGPSSGMRCGVLRRSRMHRAANETNLDVTVDALLLVHILQSPENIPHDGCNQHLVKSLSGNGNKGSPHAMQCHNNRDETVSEIACKTHLRVRIFHDMKN